MFRNRMAPADDDQNQGGSVGDTENTTPDDDQKDYKKLYLSLQKTSQASYAGLQKTLQKVQTDYDALKSTHVGVTGQFNELQKTHATTQETLDALSKRLEAELPELANLRSFKERTDLLHSKFPGLVSFEAEGLLPTGGTVEELTTKLTAFQTKLGNLSQIADQQARDGGTPPPPGDNNDTPSSADEFLKLAITASAAGNFDEFDKQFDLYLKAGGKQVSVVP